MRFRTYSRPFFCRVVPQVMNCRPNDLAVLVRNTQNLYCMQAQMGLVLRVGIPVQTPDGPAWMRRGRVMCRLCGAFDVFLDADLQPIRGDAPPDETVRDIIEEITA